MHKYIYGILGLVIAYFYYENSGLSDTVLHHEQTIAGMQSSLQLSRDVFEKKLLAVDQKQKSDQKISTEFSKKRKECKTDEKAVSIIAIGVPVCLQ